MTSKVSAMNKFKSMGMKWKDQATDYIKDNPEQVESMKEQAIGALKETVDKEAKKEEAKIGQEEDDGTKPSKFNKYKADAINALKPQLDKMTAQQEAAAAAAAAAAEEDEDENTDVEETTDSTTTTNENRSSTNIKADTHTSSSDDKVQDLVAGLLSMLDDSNLSKEEQKKTVNVFNAAFALKHIS